MSDPLDLETAPRVWQVGALCRAVADAVAARFNPVAAVGEVSGFQRAPSGHCYFTLKDGDGQLRCALFKRAAGLLERLPRDGQLVEVRGRLDLYAPRGDLQLVVESLRPAGQGQLYEQFLARKARLEALGLFEPGRKRPLIPWPRAIGLVTSASAAALHDVASALARRAPHLPVVLAPSAVQGEAAPRELVAALSALYAQAGPLGLDAILLVRGGGSLEDLWAFNDEALAHAIARSPVPLVCGVGHETDVTLADLCADLRAPTPTAAAELVAPAGADQLRALERLASRLAAAAWRCADGQAQRLDLAAQRLSRPGLRLALQRQRLQALAHRLRWASRQSVRHGQAGLDSVEQRLAAADPRALLARGYALLHDESGRLLRRAADARPGQRLTAQLQDGPLALEVSPGSSR